MLENLKKRWGINSNLQAIKIIIVFGITGSLAAWLSKPFISFLNIVDEGTFLSWILRLIIIFPIYQIILIIVATLFGEFKWFWNFLKKMLIRMGFRFLSKY
ncbi:MAG: diacylglyceryl transferase [Flavobacteriaceae bacterium]|nr:diacylglyceryl transferase [Flavobacteriaceae bacterium]|tara:strand:- start:1041 stop:1343 length:303 start_codon:yes stop_codon:yes gene_type:complete